MIMRQPFLSISFFIIVLLGSAVSGAYANDNTNTTQHTKTILIRDKICNPSKPRCPSKPVMCLYGSNFVTIELPPDVLFAEIEISSDNNSIISGDITQDYPTLNFAELTGNYTIVLNTHSDDSTIITYIGELIF